MVALHLKFIETLAPLWLVSDDLFCQLCSLLISSHTVVCEYGLEQFYLSAGYCDFVWICFNGEGATSLKVNFVRRIFLAVLDEIIEPLSPTYLNAMQLHFLPWIFLKTTKMDYL